MLFSNFLRVQIFSRGLPRAGAYEIRNAEYCRNTTSDTSILVMAPPIITWYYIKSTAKSTYLYFSPYFIHPTSFIGVVWRCREARLAAIA